MTSLNQLCLEFLKTQKAKFNDFDLFKQSGLFKHLESIFGELCYVESSEHFFIGIDKDGFFYDEIYYPLIESNRVASIFPKSFKQFKTKNSKIDKIWKDVATKGFAILKADITTDLVNKVTNESFIPFGYIPEFNLSKNMQFPYFGNQFNYENPEKHWAPEYFQDVITESLRFIPRGMDMTANGKLFTNDMVRYTYAPEDNKSLAGPYRFHYDHFPRLSYMFFIYFSKISPILGREIRFGKKNQFTDFSIERFEDKSFYEKVEDRDVDQIAEVKIENQMIILVNTVNPLFVHKVEKLKHDNEVVLLTNYCWLQPWD